MEYTEYSYEKRGNEKLIIVCFYWYILPYTLQKIFFREFAWRFQKLLKIGYFHDYSLHLILIFFFF